MSRVNLQMYCLDHESHLYKSYIENTLNIYINVYAKPLVQQFSCPILMKDVCIKLITWCIYIWANGYANQSCLVWSTWVKCIQHNCTREKHGDFLWCKVFEKCKLCRWTEYLSINMHSFVYLDWYGQDMYYLKQSSRACYSWS